MRFLSKLSMLCLYDKNFSCNAVIMTKTILWLVNLFNFSLISKHGGPHFISWKFMSWHAQIFSKCESWYFVNVWLKFAMYKDIKCRQKFFLCYCHFSKNTSYIRGSFIGAYFQQDYLINMLFSKHITYTLFVLMYGAIQFVQYCYWYISEALSEDLSLNFLIHLSVVFSATLQYHFTPQSILICWQMTGY